MNCVEFRRLLGSDPQSNLVDFVRHRQECARCAEAAARATEFDNSLRRALAIDTPPSLADSILLAQATSQQGRRRVLRRGSMLALAASLILAVGVVGMRLEAKPLSTLAVDHLGGEAFALSLTDPIPADAIKQAFAKRGVDLPVAPDGVSYVACCPVGRFSSVHMVMPQTGGAVTVMYIANHHSDERQDFTRDGWLGRSVPAGNGTLVLLAHNTDHFDALENIWRTALQTATTHS
jgi:hypothetical protein